MSLNRKTTSLAPWLCLLATAAGQTYEDTGWKTAGRSGIPNANEVFPSQEWREVQLHKTSAVSQAAQNCVRLQFGNHGGSGVYLGERLIQSCWHVPEGASNQGTATFTDGRVINVHVIQRDTVWDLVTLEMQSEHPTLTGVELARANPQQGQSVYSAGYGAGYLRIFGGPTVEGWGSPANGAGGGASDWFHHIQSSIPGDSGGPVFTTNGKLCGTLWGGNGRSTTATGTGRLTLFLRPLFPRLAAWRARRIGNQIGGVLIQNLPNQSQCLPGYGCAPPSSSGGRGVVQSPYGQPTPTQPTYPNQPTYPTQPTQPPTVDYEKIVDALLPKLAADERFRGPAGKDGKDGEKGERGSDGKDGQDGMVSQSHIRQITQDVVNALAGDSRLKGASGSPGSKGQNGKDGRGVTRLFVDKDGKLKTEFTDGTVETVAGAPLAKKRDDSPFPDGGTVKPPADTGIAFYSIVPRK